MMSSSKRLLTAVAVVAASVASALASVAAVSPDDGSDAIHWQTDRVDLRAESLTLELFDQTFSPDGVDVTIAEDASGKRRWYVDVRWTEDDHSHALVFNFRHSDDDWYVDSVAWWLDGPVPLDHGGRYGFAAFQARNATRTPLERAFEGDVHRNGTGARAACEGARMGLVQVDRDGAALSIEGLRLTVAPRERSLVERALRFAGLTDELEQDVDLLAQDCSLGGGNVTPE